jgi:hypothetical protein
MDLTLPRAPGQGKCEVVPALGCNLSHSNLGIKHLVCSGKKRQGIGWDLTACPRNKSFFASFFSKKKKNLLFLKKKKQKDFYFLRCGGLVTSGLGTRRDCRSRLGCRYI